MNFVQLIKLNFPKRYLLFCAAFVWTFAGGMLLFKGILILYKINLFLGLRIIVSTIGGLIFYLALFSKISLKHARRIIELKNDKPFLFAFFSIKSYILMIIMITSGILLRMSGIISQQNLSVVYLTMGIPLFLSAFRFYYYGFYYNILILKK
jgi:hypothetical protein